MTEKDALAAGITANPPEVRAALGFGSPPFGVPAAARDMPTEAQREAAEKASVEVQTAVEERNNASAEVTEAKREKTATAQTKKAAEKAVLEADPEDLSARQAELVRADKADKKAKENLAKKEKALEKAEKRAVEVEEKKKGVAVFWRLVLARLRRLAVGVSKKAAEVLEDALRFFDELKNGILGGVPVLVGVGADGKAVSLGRGDAARKKIRMFSAKQQKGQQSQNYEKIKSFKEVKNRKDLFEVDVKNPKLAKIKQRATGVTEKTVEILSPDEIPEGKLPRVGSDIPEKERERPLEPLGSRHRLPLTKNSREKIENTMYSSKDSSTIQKDMDAIRDGYGVPVRIKTTYNNGFSPKDVFGFIVRRDGKVRIYGIEHNGEVWRAFPVAGDDFIELNSNEYNALFDCLIDKKTIQDIEFEYKRLISEKRLDMERLKRAIKISQEAVQ